MKHGFLSSAVLMVVSEGGGSFHHQPRDSSRAVTDGSSIMQDGPDHYTSPCVRRVEQRSLTFTNALTYIGNKITSHVRHKETRYTARTHLFGIHKPPPLHSLQISGTNTVPVVSFQTKDRVHKCPPKKAVLSVSRQARLCCHANRQQDRSLSNMPLLQRIC